MASRKNAGHIGRDARVRTTFSHRVVAHADVLRARPARQRGWREDYPSRWVRLVVPSPAGGGTDIIARHLAQRLTERFRHPVFVENRAGAGSLVGTDFVARRLPTATRC